jgi:hypothetical protein
MNHIIPYHLYESASSPKMMTVLSAIGHLPDEGELIWEYMGVYDMGTVKFPVHMERIGDIATDAFHDSFEHATKEQKAIISGYEQEIRSGDVIRPLLIDPSLENPVVDGNHRLMAAYRVLGTDGTVPVIDITD